MFLAWSEGLRLRSVLEIRLLIKNSPISTFYMLLSSGKLFYVSNSVQFSSASLDPFLAVAKSPKCKAPFKVDETSYRVTRYKSHVKAWAL